MREENILLDRIIDRIAKISAVAFIVFSLVGHFIFTQIQNIPTPDWWLGLVKIIFN